MSQFSRSASIEVFNIELKRFQPGNSEVKTPRFCGFGLTPRVAGLEGQFLTSAKGAVTCWVRGWVNSSMHGSFSGSFSLIFLQREVTWPLAGTG